MSDLDRKEWLIRLAIKSGLTVAAVIVLTYPRGIIKRVT